MQTKEYIGIAGGRECHLNIPRNFNICAMSQHLSNALCIKQTQTICSGFAQSNIEVAFMININNTVYWSLWIIILIDLIRSKW